MNDGSFIKAFKKLNRIRLLAIVICILVASASSCTFKRDLRRSKNTESTDVSANDPDVQAGKEETSNSTVSDTINEQEGVEGDTNETLPDSVKVEFIFTNSTKEDIGMISILDPVSSEQINLGELPDSKIMKVSLDWPKEKTDFDMAVYNRNGDLVSETKVDISGVTEQVTLLLSGDHNIENVEAKIK